MIVLKFKIHVYDEHDSLVADFSADTLTAMERYIEMLDDAYRLGLYARLVITPMYEEVPDYA